MAKDKDRQVNPAQAQRKADKAKALKKSKAQLTTQRNEKLARRNPHRLQKQIDELKAAEASGNLRPKDKQTLEQLEKDVGAIKKAREALGDRAPEFGRAEGRDGRGERGGFHGRGRGGNGVLGKRRRFEREESETDEDAKDIPMPKDIENMPPIPRRQRPDRAGDDAASHTGPHGLPSKPPVAAPTRKVYESAPLVRNLQKEATSRFVPAAVQAKMKAVKGQGRLLEPEELERLEKEGYKDASKAVDEAVKEAEFKMMSAEDGTDSLEDAERKFEQELRRVEIEEVEDEDL